MHILIYKNVPKNRDFISGLNRSGQSSLNLDRCIRLFSCYIRNIHNQNVYVFGKEFAIWQIAKSRARLFYDLATFSLIKISGNLKSLHYLQKKLVIILDRVDGEIQVIFKITIGYYKVKNYNFL